MTEIILANRATNTNSKRAEFYDKAGEAGIAINQDAYASSTDRVYDLEKYPDAFSIVLKNTHGSNGTTYKIDSTREESVTGLFDDVAWDAEVAETNLASGAKITALELLRLFGTKKALRLQVKRQTSAQDSSLKLFVTAK